MTNIADLDQTAWRCLSVPKLWILRYIKQILCFLHTSTIILSVKFNYYSTWSIHCVFFCEGKLSCYTIRLYYLFCLSIGLRFSLLKCPTCCCSITCSRILWLHVSLVTRKPVFGVCDQVRLKPACSSTETSKRLEISAIASRGIILPRQRKQRR